MHLSCAAQTRTDTCKWEYDSLFHSKVYTWVDQMPQYKEGQTDVLQFFSKNFKYPISQKRFQGSVNLAFIITASGEIRNASVLGKEKKNFTEVDKEALRVLSIMQRWKPGECHGIKVPVKILLPLKF